MDISFGHITVEELACLMAQAPTDLQLVDVREPEELAIAALPGFQSFPLSQSALWVSQIAQQLDPTVETIVLCHHGVRSAHMCQWLGQQGFTNVKNVVGGIDAYARVVDPAVPRY
jgi:rhodanese-related sulfurtransferase